MLLKMSFRCEQCEFYRDVFNIRSDLFGNRFSSGRADGTLFQRIHRWAHEKWTLFSVDVFTMLAAAAGLSLNRCRFGRTGI